MQAILVSNTNPKGEVTINDMDLAALLEQVYIFAQNIHTLAHIRTAVDKTAVQGCYKRGSVSSPTAVGPILWDLSFLTRTHQIYSSVWQIKFNDNTMTDAASRLTHITDKMFLQHFLLTFLQKHSWWLLKILSGCRQRLNSMLNSKRYCMAVQPPSSKNTPLPGANGASSDDDWESQLTPKVSGIPSLSSRYFLSACASALWKPARSLPISGPWNSTFVPLDRYSQKWGPATLGTTSLASSTFDWDKESWLTWNKTLLLPEYTLSLSLSSKNLTLPIME